MGELSGGPARGPARGPDDGRRDGGGAARPAAPRVRAVAACTLLAIFFGVAATMTVVFFASRRQQARVRGRLGSDLALAERTREELERRLGRELAEALAREKALRDELELREAAGPSPREPSPRSQE